MKSLLLIIITTALVNNVVLSQFLGICSFLGVSRYIKTSFSLGAAVIFVITVASAVANLLYTLRTDAPESGLSENHRLYSGHRGSGADGRDVYEENISASL